MMPHKSNAFPVFEGARIFSYYFKSLYEKSNIRDKMYCIAEEDFYYVKLE